MNELEKRKRLLMSINHDLVASNVTKRQGLIVYLNSVSNQYKLRRFGDIVYFSKKMNYCVLYVDQKNADKTIAVLNSLDFVNGVDRSNGENIDLSSTHIEQQIKDLASEAEEQLLEEQEKNTEQLS